LTPQHDSIHELVGRARRRFFFNVALSQAVLAASVGMAGAVLILLFGDQFLDWRWLALLALLTFPIAYFRTARRVPGLYKVAQVLDDRMQLKDSLSTALYFSEVARPDSESEDMRQAQRAASERMVSQVDPKIAVPLTAPRTLYVLGSLFLTAVTLFGLRYGIQRTMDLNRPLTSVLIDALGGSNFAKRAAVNKNKKSTMDIWGQTQVDSMSGAETQYKDGEDMKGQEFLDQAPDGVLNTVDVPEVDKGINEQSADSKNKSDSSKGGAGESQSEDQQESADAAKGPQSPKGGDPSGGSKQGDQASKQPPNNSGDSSLASKIKDAMSNLMAAMRTKQNGQNARSGAQESGADQKSQQQTKNGQKGAGQGQKAGGEQSSSAEMGQPGEEGEGGKSADLKGGNQGDGPNGPDSGSGAGKQEGEKAAKLAEQAAAMGKISEIIGKRSANVTGEVTIEVTSSKQPLRTPYADGKAAHGEAGAEINRDEVPAAFQDYVQQYFEQVRKPAKGSGKAPAASPQASSPPSAR
jgi:hypothetical protein